MLRIHEHGLKHRENLRYYLTKPKCLGGGASFVSATLVDTAPVIFKLLWGFGLSLTILVFEIIAEHSVALRNKLLSLKNKYTGK